MRLYKYDISSAVWSIVSTANTPTHRYFGGSCLHNKIFYLLPGVNSAGENVANITSIDLTQSLPAWQVQPIAINTELLYRNSYSHSQQQNLGWLFSGWVNERLKNDLIYLDFSTSPITVSTLTEASLNPPARFDHSMNVVNDQLYIFGGKDRTK